MTAAAQDAGRGSLLPALAGRGSGVRAPGPLETFDYQGARRMWRAVLAVNLRVALGSAYDGRVTELDIYQARQWVGGRDFREACALAGSEPDYVLERLRRKGL